MLDIKWIRENPEELKKGLEAKNTQVDIEQLLSLDQEKRGLLAEVESQPGLIHRRLAISHVVKLHGQPMPLGN